MSFDRDSRPKKFDLNTLQCDSEDLPSLSSLQSNDKAPSLSDLQKDTPSLPTLKSFQSDERLDSSIKTQKVGKVSVNSLIQG